MEELKEKLSELNKKVKEPNKKITKELERLQEEHLPKISAPPKTYFIHKSATLNLVIQNLRHESARANVCIGQAMARVRSTKNQIL